MESQRIRLDDAVELDPSNERLLVQGQSVPLRPKVYGVLRYLVRHPDRIVTKDELLDAIWADTVVGDSVLKVCVRELRNALDDDTKAPRFIETVHRRGYRYVGRAEVLGGEAAAPPARQSAVQPGRQVSRQASYSASDSASLQPGDGSFVARELELGHLGGALAAAAAGNRRTVFISGPAGIGKTALVEETLRRFSSQAGTRLVRGRCQESLGTTEPYLPFLECVRELVEKPAAVEKLRRIAPTWLAQFPWLIEESDRGLLERELHGATPSRMLRELDVFLEDATREETVVLVLEDLHWADASSLDLLSFLSSRDSSARLLLIAVTRSTELLADGHPLSDVKGQLMLQGHCTDLPLDLLGPDDVREMLGHRLGSASVSDEVAPWLHSRTEGHPLFIVHLLEHLIATAHLVERETQPEGGTRWELAATRARLAELMPSTLPAILAKNLERYAGDERVVLEGASLSGYEFCVNSVADATGLDVERVEDLCEAITARGELLVTDGVCELPGDVLSAQYRFTHALLRDALRNGIPPARRVRWQRRLAECGEAVYGERAHEIAPGLATHFEEARLYGRAVHYHRLAAVGARRAFSNEIALEHLHAAEALLPRLGADIEELQRELSEEIAQTLRSSGDVQRAAEAYESVAEAAVTPDQAAEAWLLAAGARSWLGRQECTANVDRAVALVPSITDPSTVAHVEGSAAYWRLLWDGWDANGRSECERALHLAEEHGHANHALGHRARLAFFLTLEGEYDAAAAAAEAAHEEAIALGDASESMLAHFYRGLALLQGGRLDEARAHTTRARDEAVRNGHAPWSLLFGTQLAWIAAEQGEPEALSLAEASVKSAQPLGHDFIPAFAQVVAGLAAVAGGDESQARARLEANPSEPFLMDWLCQLIALAGLSKLGDRDAQRRLRDRATPMGAQWFLNTVEPATGSDRARVR